MDVRQPVSGQVRLNDRLEGWRLYAQWITSAGRPHAQYILDAA
jgi:hypothetical protein